MAPYYRIVTSTAALPLDQTLLDSMEKANKDELDKLDERLVEAEKTEGESEISDALKARANYLTRVGDKVCRVHRTIVCHAAFMLILSRSAR
jgi:26S proteasome regulatory subunit N7